MMLCIARLALLFFITPLCAAAIADETPPAISDDDLLPKVAMLAAAMLADLDDESREQLFYAAQGAEISNGELRRRIAHVDFTDNSTISRLSKLRGVSLLTVAEVGDSRLYIGVNDDGLVGVHFNAFMRSDRARHLELIRLPYLAED